MGDRAVVGFASSVSAPTIYLYSHWGGSNIVAETQRALLASESRWDDPEYATRIAISHIVGIDWQAETGYGLSVDSYTMPDLPYVLRVVWDERKVYVLTDLTREVVGELSFHSFLAAVDEDLEPVLS